MMTEMMDSDNPKALKKASVLLRKGEIVALPTETVYGLAADALNEKAVKKIFKAKGRPQDNPLIVHISDFSQLDVLAAEVNSQSLELMKKFWPGPLTLILKRGDVPDVTTAGLDTVALRMPSDDFMRNLISETGPLAAPSANISGRPSPTRAEHVHRDLAGKIPLIINGGACRHGLESTVIDARDSPVILRPGAVSREDIEKVIGKTELNEEGKAVSPGMKYRHYSPETPLKLVESEDFLEFVETHKCYSISFSGLKADRMFDNLEQGAREIFDVLRKADMKHDLIVVEKPEPKGLGLALLNRLEKASVN